MCYEGQETGKFLAPCVLIFPEEPSVEQVSEPEQDYYAQLTRTFRNSFGEASSAIRRDHVPEQNLYRFFLSSIVSFSLLLSFLSTCVFLSRLFLFFSLCLF